MRSKITRILVLAGFEWQARAWMNAQPEHIRCRAAYVRGLESILGLNPSVTRYVSVGMVMWGPRTFLALEELERRGIRHLAKAEQ